LNPDERKRDDGRQPMAAVNQSRLTWPRRVTLKAPNMRSCSSVAVLVSLTTLIAGLAAKVEAQEFQIEDAVSVAGLAVDQLKPKTITFIDRPSDAFIDRPSDALIDPDAGLIRFEDWMRASPIQKQLLSPYPSYLEPNLEITVDGVGKRVQGRLHMYRPIRRSQRSSW
jgi:hypothetical protein